MYVCARACVHACVCVRACVSVCECARARACERVYSYCLVYGIIMVQCHTVLRFCLLKFVEMCFLSSVACTAQGVFLVVAL